jgi:hypothetical protein
MKKNILILLFLSINYNVNAQSKNIYVIIDNKYEEFFKFKKENDPYFSSIKVLKYDKRDKGFNKKENSQKKNDIIVVLKQPIENNYYEFQSYDKPKEEKNINLLKIYSIEEISRNIEPIHKIWTDSDYSIVFIEKIGCNYNLWKMKPIQLE